MEPEIVNWITLVKDHFVTILAFDLGRYLVAATGTVLLLWFFKEWSESRRIQKRRADRKDYIREIFSSFRTVFFFGLMGLSTLFLIEAGAVKIQQGNADPGLFAAQVAVLALAHDAYSYWMHRMLHHRKLFRATHLHHHKSRTPTPWAAYSFSSWEGMLESAFMPLFLLTASLVGIAFVDLAIFVFLAWMILRNVIGHAGVEVHPAGWTDTPWLDWMTTTTHHDLHHSEGRHNFGLYFTWWDRWMRTEHPRYKEEFRSVAKPLTIAANSIRFISISALSAAATLTTLTGGLQVMGALPT